MLAIKNSKSYEVLPSPPNLELIVIKIASSIPVIYCLVYIPPKSSDKCLQDFFNFLTDYKNITDSLIVFGDFNFNDINWNSLYGNTSSSEKFCETVFELNLTQLIDEAIHIHGNILDLLLTNNIDIIHDITVNPSNFYQFHLTTNFITTFKTHSNICMPYTFDRLVIKIPILSNWDLVGLCHYLRNVDFTPCFLSNKPLHYLFSLCLNSGYLPFEWKLHKVTPIYKSDDRCPISLLCNTSKVLK